MARAKKRETVQRKQLPVSFSDEIWDELEAAAERTGRTRSGLVRLIVTLFFEREEFGTIRRRVTTLD